MSNIIKPSIGRKVWYWHDHKTAISVAPSDENPLGHLYPKSIDPLQAMDATVIYVWGDRMVNLRITDHVGRDFIATSVTLVQPGDPTPASSHCRWMDYQVKQQAVSETIEQTSKSIDSLLAEIMERDRDEDLNSCALELAKSLSNSEQDYGCSVVDVDGEEFLVSVARVNDDTATIIHSIAHEHTKARQEAGLEIDDISDIGATLCAVSSLSVGAHITVSGGVVDGTEFGCVTFNLAEPASSSLFEAVHTVCSMQAKKI